MASITLVGVTSDMIVLLFLTLSSMQLMYTDSRRLALVAAAANIYYIRVCRER
jgi:hypothetical protein